MGKSQDAFRTISEVSDALDTPAHVLRFWESKFNQVKPVKRAGGRRYYRPDDLALLSGIKKLLHDQGMTIKGAQKLLREEGVKHVIGLGDEALGHWAEGAVEQVLSDAAIPVPEKAPVIVEVQKPEPAPEIKAVVAPPVVAPSRPSSVPGAPLTFAETLPEIADFAPLAPQQEASARFFESFAKADQDGLRAGAQQIAPLVAKLEAIHAKMVSR